MKKIKIQLDAEKLKRKLNLKDGEKGDIGLPGKEGKQGKQGPKGDRGDRGYNGIDGANGKNGINGKDGSPDTRLQIVEKINTGGKKDLKIESRHISGLEEMHTDTLKRATAILDQRTQFLINKHTGGTWGRVNGTITDQTDLVSYIDAKISVENIFDRTLTVISPHTAGDSLNMGTGGITTTGLGTFGNLDVDTLNFNGNAITDSTGAISFGNENLTTTGNITSNAVTLTGATGIMQDTGGGVIIDFPNASLTVNNLLTAYDLSVLNTFSAGNGVFTGTVYADAGFGSYGSTWLELADTSVWYSSTINANGANLTGCSDIKNTSGYGYDYASDTWALGYALSVDYIFGGSYGQVISLYDEPGAVLFNSTNIAFEEGVGGTIYVRPSTGYAYEGGDMTLRAGDGLLGGGAPNATGGTLYLEGGASSGATEGAVYIYGAIAEDVFETDIENIQVPFVSYSGGVANSALPMFLYKGTGTAYKNQMVAYYFNGISTYTSRTAECRSAFGTAFTLLADTNDYFYVGLQSHPFTNVYFDLATNGSGLTILVEYWNGSDWIDLDGMSGPPLLADTTNNFSNSGYISVDHSGMLDWTANAVSGTTAYWIRISTSAVTIAPTCYKIGTNYFATPMFRAYTDASTVSYYSAWNGYNGIYTASPQAMLHIGMPNIAGVETLRLAAGGSTGDANLNLYYNASYNAKIWLDGSTTDLYIDNGGNNSNSEIYFRTKTLGTPVNNLILKDTSATFGTTANTDITVNFTGTTYSGQFLWMEDEDYFKFSDDILMNSTERIYFRDTAIGIYSQADTFLDLFVDGGLRIGDSSAGAPTNYTKFASNGDQTFTGTAGFYPRVLNQADEPAAGTGATQLDTGEMCIWTDTDDSKCYACYNHGGTIKTVELV